MGDSVFWGVIVEPGKPSAYVPPPEENARLHVSQAVLDPAAEDGARVWLQCKVQDGVPLAVAALRCGGTEAQPLDLILDQYTEFTVQGPSSVHVTGYYIPLEDYEDDEDEEHNHDDEIDQALATQYGLPAGVTLNQMRQLYADGDLINDEDDDDDDDDDDDEDDEDDEDDDDDAMPVFFDGRPGGAAFGVGNDDDDEDDDDDDEDEDDDEERSDYGSDEEADGRTKSEVLIEEIDPKQPEEVAKAAGQKRKADSAAMESTPAKKPAGQAKPAASAANGAVKAASGQQTPAHFGDAGADAMDEDDDEEEEGDDEDEAEEDELPQAQQHQAQPGSGKQQQKASVAAKQDGAQPKAQQQNQQQQRQSQRQQQKQPASTEAADKTATAAKAAGQQQAAQKKGKNGKQPEANGLATPAAATAGATPKTPATASTGRKSVRRFENGFMIEDTGMGQPDGKLAKGGKRVQMKYVGRLASNGKVFDQTKGSKPFTFRLGVGEVIKGWDRGVEGMRVGDKRKLTIPPSMAYGTKGAPPDIPPNAKLVFDVELVNVL